VLYISGSSVSFLSRDTVNMKLHNMKIFGDIIYKTVI
jgi:hypothetical protein